ncbi:MAG: alpha/beta hydrolase [Phyllobacteriaceae bacterium]|nr:alpha/beta hydrolase [Phyllobacteriaceae bacterium]
MSFHFTETENNPVPPNGFGGFFSARDGVTLRYGVFRTQSRPHLGTIVILPGRNEPIEKYFETISDVMAMGYDAAIIDWRGQGFSGRLLADRRKGHVGSFADYAADLRQFLADIVLPDCRAPYHLLGHSMGGLAALLAAPWLGNQVSRIVLSAPLLEFGEAPVSTGRLGQITRALSAIGLGSHYLIGSKEKSPDFLANVLTSDPRRFWRNIAIRRAAPELALGGPTVGWISAACQAIDVARDPEFIARIHVPVLLIAAGSDTVVSNRAIEDFARRPRAGAHLTIDGARHELLQESDVYREPFLAAMHAYFSGDIRAEADYLTR